MRSEYFVSLAPEFKFDNRSEFTIECWWYLEILEEEDGVLVVGLQFLDDWLAYFDLLVVVFATQGESIFQLFLWVHTKFIRLTSQNVY